MYVSKKNKTIYLQFCIYIDIPSSSERVAPKTKVAKKKNAKRKRKKKVRKLLFMLVDMMTKYKASN